MSKPIAVVFLKSWRGYSKGEVAGFAQDEAERLVDNKVAEYKGKAPAKKKGAAGAAAGGQPSTDDQGGSDDAGGNSANDDNDDGKP